MVHPPIRMRPTWLLAVAFAALSTWFLSPPYFRRPLSKKVSSKDLQVEDLFWAAVHTIRLILMQSGHKVTGGDHAVCNFDVEIISHRVRR